MRLKNLKLATAKACIIAFSFTFIFIAAKAGDPIKRDKPLFFKILQQDQQFLLVDGIVKYGAGTKLGGVEVLLSSKGEILDQLITDKSGRYKFVLQKNSRYKIIIRKPGYEPKSVIFNTEMPDYSPKYNKYMMAVFLKQNTFDAEDIQKQKDELVDPNNFQPLAKVAYDRFALEYRQGITRYSEN